MLKENEVREKAGIKVRALSPGFGAEIIGVDLSRPVDDATAEAIRDIWIEAGLLLVRDPKADDEA